MAYKIVKSPYKAKDLLSKEICSTAGLNRKIAVEPKAKYVRLELFNTKKYKTIPISKVRIIFTMVPPYIDIPNKL